MTQDAHAPAPLRQVRTRLRVALLVMAVFPVIGAAGVVFATRGAPSTLLGVLALAAPLLLAAVVLPGRILRPIDVLHRSQLELQRLYETAREDALRDALTGLGNHRAFQEELERQFELYSRYQVPVALLLIDVDDLKLVNDVHGHAGGDELLREAGRLMSSLVRYTDRAFRIGGDEFAILMPHTPAEGAVELGRRLLDRAGNAAAGRRIRFSGGVSACPALATTRDELYAQADAALYWSKRHGRASIDVFDPARDRDAGQAATTELSSRVARVAGNRLLTPVYQPIVDLVDGRVIGFEGLVRPSPESGFPHPGALFSAAEAVGRTVELDHACLDVVLAGARAIPADTLVSVNVSPRTIEAVEFSAQGLLAIVERHGIDPGRVIVELTEREQIQDLARLQRNLGALQQAGVRVAADDVGAGNAGLRLLSQFRFDIVKIDLSLVQDGAQHDTSREVLRSLHGLTTRWGAFVIAEGLETAEQLRAVRELGMGAGQGYLLGRPSADTALTFVDVANLASGGAVLSVPRVAAVASGSAGPRA